MISQTAHFPGLTPERLYHAFLSAEDHAAMTADGRQHVSYQRPDGQPADDPQAGDQLLAFGQPADGGAVEYRLTARLLDLVPGERIVMAWRSAAWDAATGAATDPATSVVVLRFASNMAGAEIRLDQTGVPVYEVQLPDTGERGPLETIVNTHWNLLYWEPMRQYFSAIAR
jgi:uncharacterized protein YndB with AHSA1/START domain